MFNIILYVPHDVSLTFWGKFRGTHEQEHHVHESPANMTIPLLYWLFYRLLAGMIGVPAVMGGHHELGAYLAPVYLRNQSRPNYWASTSLAIIRNGS
jgi:NADH:ubiquinone oxidoreductase subunit 5 (subunit L)/multisubunit Na+/H+ antiporter MnhA subunit